MLRRMHMFIEPINNERVTDYPIDRINTNRLIRNYEPHPEIPILTYFSDWGYNPFVTAFIKFQTTQYLRRNKGVMPFPTQLRS